MRRRGWPVICQEKSSAPPRKCGPAGHAEILAPEVRTPAAATPASRMVLPGRSSRNVHRFLHGRCAEPWKAGTTGRFFGDSTSRLPLGYSQLALLPTVGRVRYSPVIGLLPACSAADCGARPLPACLKCITRASSAADRGAWSRQGEPRSRLLCRRERGAGATFCPAPPAPQKPRARARRPSGQ